jgi:probable rRNA maturation factor
MNVVIINRQRTKKIDARRLKLAAATLFTELNLTDGELGVNLVNARQMTLINETFLKHEGSTDVITFDHGDQPFSKKCCVPEIHGELFICVDEAMIQARRFKTHWRSEVIRYFVHGVLHLLGHDDLKTAPRRSMKREENRLVRLLEKDLGVRRPARNSK